MAVRSEGARPMGIDLTRPVTISPATHRCFDRLVTAQAALAGFMAGNITHSTGLPYRFEPGSSISQVCYVEPVEVEVDGAGVLGAVSNRGWPTDLQIGFHRRASPVAPAATLNGIQRLMASIYEHAFLSYFESVHDHIKGRYGKVARWPMELNFGRVVRNAFGHGGNVRIDSGPPVVWRGVRESPPHTGPRVLFQHL